MGLKLVTDVASVSSFLQKAAELLKSSCLTALSKLGEECVAKIRDRPARESWIDRTGNLRSSIGYSVYDRGVVIIKSAFSVVLHGSDGAAKGDRMIEELASEFNRVYALVVVAAMEYASDVEAIESKDVLESTRIWALSVVEKRLKTAIDDAISKINSWKI